MPLLHHQPFKAIYIVAEITIIFFFRVPFWIVISIPKSRRPRPSWSLSRSVLVYALRRYFLLNFWVGGVLRAPNYLALQKGKDVNGVWVNAAPDSPAIGIRGRERLSTLNTSLPRLTRLSTLFMAGDLFLSRHILQIHWPRLHMELSRSVKTLRGSFALNIAFQNGI